ncbi:hypothetical protein Q8W71_28950 [Methylobacterium sp. NEAU 140]|uniref:hypothetical protein n=1 Tax=Methylobacterium sp. NEAU 140 TaxID=3064945 RepID=UPI0027346B04|nr:hypothetical protein [Methylobacterium sp. NEAU 140]MDP4026640.1 hypothetical protein [Methylobacterium sp. NEAU 140]
MRATTKQRLAKIENRLRHPVRGAHCYTDDELDGLIAVLRQGEAGEAIDPNREEWAAELLHRKCLLP